MKTSNKIILATFLTPLVILTALNLTLYAKYKSGNYTDMKSIAENRYTSTLLKKTTYVSVYGLTNFHIIPSDTLKLEIEKSSHSYLHHSETGDSLIIHGDSLVTEADGSPRSMRSNEAVNLYIPSAVTIAVTNSEIELHGSKDSTRPVSYHFLLSSSNFTIAENHYNDSGHLYFNQLTIEASKSSETELSAYTRVADLKLMLHESVFADNGAFINRLVIQADNLSGISLKGDNLNKITPVK
ncbi:MAG: hypothetical protein ABIU63_08760 [Chitinophagaceae bacterium]